MMEGDSKQSPHRRMERGAAPLLLLFFILATPTETSHFNVTCAPGLNTPGATYPRGDIVLEEGSSLEVFCILNPLHKDAMGRNSSDLVFYRNDELVSKEFVNVVNSTTLRLYVKEMPASNSMYYCRLKSLDGEKSVCLNKVDVGYKPQEVHNFSCTSHNWLSLTCSWVPPRNYVKTEYSIVYRLPGRAGGRIQHGCPDNIDVRENRCLWNSSTKPHYRQPYDYYFFTLIGQNALGNISTTIKFHHYAHVIPAEPRNLEVLNKTTNSILLRWHTPYPLQVFPPGIIQKVEYQNQWESRSVWQVANTSYLNIRANDHIYNLTNLKYAHTLYDIRVYMKSAAAIGDDVWSKPAGVTVWTDSCVPGAAPKTDIGSFEVSGGLPNRDVYIYWQQIPDYIQNGNNFEYKVTEVRENGSLRYMIPHEISRAYAKFKGLSFNSYTFTVVSSNKEGYSKDSSVVYIPSRLDSPGEPLSFTKIAFGEGIYELSWKPPKDHEKIENYTIFWCNNDRDRPYQCAGYLNWTHVPKEIQIINITVPEEKIYQFAISANSKTASSGMVWASCTVIHNKAVGKMKSVWINRSGSTFIEVGWKLECSDRIGLVQGYRIYYCPIMSPYNLKCKEPERNMTFDAGEIHGKIVNLKPYTTYMMAVSVLTKSGEGLQSDPLYNTTFEGAPDTPPTNVTISEVTNTTMKVSWSPPVSLNGVLRYYEVFFNENSMKVEDKPYVVLENLNSYTNYSVSVAACTVSCSMKSEPLVQRTEVGIPGTMERPIAVFTNSSQVLVTWRPPAGTADFTFYELKIGHTDGHGHLSEEEGFRRSDGHESYVAVSDCKKEGSQISTFSVRAVNVDSVKTIYRGNWSEVVEANCFNSGPSRLTIWLIIGFSLLGVAALLLILIKWAWTRCKEMQDVEVKLPPGLESFPPEKEKGPEIYAWPREPFPCEDHDDRPSTKSGLNGAADEELLLHQKERHGRNPSGDSSGCSSAHDSVSSALTSGTQISSDSGADVDRCAPSPDIMLRSKGESTLRLRNVPPPPESYSSPSLHSDITEAHSGSQSTVDSLSRQGKESPIQSWEYSRFGVTESSPENSPQPGGYVSLASVTTPSAVGAESDNHGVSVVSSIGNSNYVAHPNIWVPKESPISIPECSRENEPVSDEGSAFVGDPGSYCRIGWRPGAEPSQQESEAARSERPEHPFVGAVEDNSLVHSPVSEGYVTVTSLGEVVPNIAENAVCHPMALSPDQDQYLDDEEVGECRTESASPEGHLTSPGYVAIGYFAKEEGIRNLRHDVVEPQGGASPSHSMANKES